MVIAAGGREQKLSANGAYRSFKGDSGWVNRDRRVGKHAPREGNVLGGRLFRCALVRPYATGCAQWAQRRADSGISLRHSGQGLVAGGAGAAGGLNLFSMYCVGSTIAK